MTSDDDDLGHLISYARKSINAGLAIKYIEQDKAKDLRLALYIDASHAGEYDRKSTGGWVLGIAGKHGTWMPIDWSSKTQPMISRSSGEAETVSFNDCMLHLTSCCKGIATSGLPALDCLRKILNPDMEIDVYVDATVCKRAIEKGHSKRMPYISITQDVDLHWLRQLVNEKLINLKHVRTLENPADMFTKFLEFGPFDKHAKTCGIIEQSS